MRNYNLDFIRGLAVLGLMYMNAYSFGIFELGYVSLTQPPVSDLIIEYISVIFIEGRFRSLFSLLFGVGLYIQWQRHQSTARLKSRLFWLMLFGLSHGFLLWAGDILFLYGVAGWFIIKYLDSDNALLLKRGCEFILLSGFTTALVMYTAPEQLIGRDSAAFIELYQQSANSYSAYFINNLLMYALMLLMVPIITLWMSAGIMLIGIYLYKQQLFIYGLTNKQLLLAMVTALLLISVRLLIQPYHSGLYYSLQELLTMLAALLMAIIYIHFAVVFCNNRATKGSIIQQAGRLAFSLYISQTLMQLVLFKILFEHWVLAFNRIDYWLVVTLLVMLQLALSSCYYRYFQQGPLEYMWRKLTMLKIRC
jgi:uncharacterized protein